jgi:SNF2 family DNA or RNA helicase
MSAVASVDLDPEHASKLVVESDFRLKDRVKAVPGARWDIERRVWTVPRTWPACIALRAEVGTSLKIGDDLRAWAEDERDRKQASLELRNQLESTSDVPDIPGFDDLFPYQFVGAELINTARRYLVMDETGTGKTRTALAGLALIEQDGEPVFPLLIVAPKSVLPSWEREIPAFFPDAVINVCSGSPTKMKKLMEPGADVYIIGYQSLRSYSRLAPYGSVKMTEDQKTDKQLQALNFVSVIADEAHRTKSPKSQQTRALWMAAKDANNRIALTGTPIQDTSEDLWAILHFVNPEEYPSKTAYVNRYLQVDWNRWGGRDVVGLNPITSKEFFTNFDAMSRRVTKEAALPFLPPKMYEIKWVTLPAKLRKSYNSMRDVLVAELETTTMSAANVLEKAGRLVQLANASGDIDEDGKFHMTLPSPKIEAFMEDIDNGDFEGQSVVVFSDSRQLIDLLAEEMTKKGLEFVQVTGSVTGDDRQAAIDRFQAGEVPFILLTRAGGEGITLTAASTMVRLVRPWSLTVHLQSEDRVHRIGSEKHTSITYVDYITEDTVEETQLLRLNGKKGRAEEVLRDSELLDLLK